MSSTSRLPIYQLCRLRIRLDLQILRMWVLRVIWYKLDHPCYGQQRREEGFVSTKGCLMLISHNKLKEYKTMIMK
jgi:hypothetical protein